MEGKLPSEKVPVVFMYQPTSFQVVTGEKLKEWEKVNFYLLKV